MRNISRLVGVGSGLTAAMGVTALFVEGYYSASQRLCPDGWSVCDPGNAEELGELWTEVVLLMPFVANIAAALVGVSTLVVMWFVGAKLAHFHAHLGGRL